ncbi:hypothetical protein AHF37_11183 [Paragonimus kellicotti]|nr:hypothetical protein AHF37_11183 [Paragonimus kellicotti]
MYRLQHFNMTILLCTPTNDEWLYALQKRFCSLSVAGNSSKYIFVLRTISPKLPSTLITDASPTSAGAVRDQEGHLVICISRRLRSVGRGYA